MKTKLVYTDKYYVDIGEHVFPTLKYRLIKQKMLENPSIANCIKFVEPEPASEKDILLIHTREYLYKLKYEKLSYQEVLTLELPYSKEIVEGAILCCGGTIMASRIALGEGLGIHIGGGFHHAFPDHGEGFCILNDIACAVKKMLHERQIKKALIIDCDLHQGNGTAYIFQNENNVYTFSIHQDNNYPFYKPKSDMDIGLPDRTKDEEYLLHLEKHIPKIISDFKPDLIMYVAGADPYEYDQLGNLALTMEGLQKRDAFIFMQARNFDIPIVCVLAGGYAIDKEDTVKIHFNTIITGIEILHGNIRYFRR